MVAGLRWLPSTLGMRVAHAKAVHAGAHGRIRWGSADRSPSSATASGCPAGPSALVVVDTGPREAAGAVVAARLADLVLVPCRPSAVDVVAVAATLREIAPARAVVVLNGCPARGQWTTEALDALAAFDVSPVTLGDRVVRVGIG